MMVIWVMCLLLAGATGIFALDDDINWAEAFENVTSHDPAKANLAREQITGQLLTKLCAEDPALAAADVRKITGQLNRPEVPIRMQASASLFVVSQCRSDSTEILVPAFTALRSHVHDTEKRIGVNSVNTLDSLTPGVPDEELAFLIELVNGQEDTLAIAATRVSYVWPFHGHTQPIQSIGCCPQQLQPREEWLLYRRFRQNTRPTRD